MNPISREEPTIQIYSNRQSAGTWVALVAALGVIITGASIAAHSLKVTSGVLLGTIVVGYMGYWFLSKSYYFVSASKAGFKDVFRAREVQFDEVRSAAKHVSRNSMTLTFVCDTRKVTMPLDPLNEAWFSAVKAELHKRDIPIIPSVVKKSSSALSVPLWQI